MKKISKDLIFSKNILNIFTDASIKKEAGETIGCAGALAYLGNNFVDKKLALFSNTTNGNAELRAIELGVNMALNFRNAQYINIFSDSKVSILGLREWIFKWVYVSSSNELRKCDGELVANQEVYINIINTILDNNLKVNFYHQKGHVTINNDKSLEKAKEIFKNSNYLTHDVAIDFIREISYMNFLIDSETRYVVKNCNIDDAKEHAMLPCYKEFDIYRYANLINAPLCVD